MYEPYAVYASLYQTCDKNCRTKWQEFSNDYSPTELQQAKHITDSIIAGNVSTINKITLIVKFLHDRFFKQLGTPSVELMNATPLDQYKKLCASKKEELWCGNFAVMTAFFCFSQGIVTRNIEIMHPGDHHVLNECYVPETETWVMTDATNNLILIKNKNGDYLNLVKFKDSMKRNELTAVRSLPGSTKTTEAIITPSQAPVQYTSSDPLYYYLTEGHKAYKISNKIKRYFFPISWYEIYDSRKHINFSFYLKDIFILLWLITGFVILVTRPKFNT